jgi:hypothetical protein
MTRLTLVPPLPPAARRTTGRATNAEIARAARQMQETAGKLIEHAEALLADLGVPPDRPQLRVIDGGQIPPR